MKQHKNKKTGGDTEINNKIKSGKKVTQWYGGPL